MILRLAARAYLFVILLVLLAPLVVVAGVSLNDQRALTFPPDGINFGWYGEAFVDPGWRGAILASVIVAALAALLAVLVALPLAWFVWRWRAPWAYGIQVLGFAPFILPPVITALGFLVFWATVGFYGNSWTVVISHAIFFVTLPLVTISLGFASIDRSYIEAAATMGADDRTQFLTVVLPMIVPYMISGYAFAFVLSLNEYIVAYMVAGFVLETLPIKIFNALRYGYTPVMAAASVLFVVVAIVVFGLIARFGDLPRLLGAWASRE